MHHLRLRTATNRLGRSPELLRHVVVDVAAELYREQADPAGLLEFSAGACDVLFDAAHELTILMHGLVRPMPERQSEQAAISAGGAEHLHLLSGLGGSGFGSGGC